MIHNRDEIAQLAQWLLEHPDVLDIAQTLRQQTDASGHIHWPTLIAAVKVTLAIMDEKEQQHR